VFGFRGQHEDIVPYPKKPFHLLPYTRTPDETLVESGPYNRACEITLSYFKPHPSVILKQKLKGSAGLQQRRKWLIKKYSSLDHTSHCAISNYVSGNGHSE